MIGLEFLINIYGYKSKDIANKLNISPVTVHDWLKGKRKIPSARITQLSKIFSIPEDMFQKELTELDKLEMQKAKLNNDWEKFDNTSEDDNMDKIFDDMNQMLDLHKKKNDINAKKYDIFDKAYNANDSEVWNLYQYLSQIINNEKVDRKIIYSMIESIHEIYKPNEESLNIIEFCDQDLTNKLKNLLKEYKNNSQRE